MHFYKLIPLQDIDQLIISPSILNCLTMEISRASYKYHQLAPCNNYFMSRGRSERKHAHQQLDRRRKDDPFSQMNQIMRSFGDMGFGGFGGALRDPFEDMLDFSRPHKGLHNAGKEGSYVCQTYVSSSTMGSDGKVKNQSYFQNSAGQHKNGHTISQKQQGYKNNDGLRRIAEERMLNDQGRKIVKEKKGNNEVEEVTNHYYNLEENEAQRFDQNWRGVDREMRFLENHQKQLQGLAGDSKQRQLGLGYEPRRDQGRNYKDNERRQQALKRQPLQRQPLQEGKKSKFAEPARGYNAAESRGNFSQKSSSYKSGYSKQH